MKSSITEKNSILSAASISRDFCKIESRLEVVRGEEGENGKWLLINTGDYHVLELHKCHDYTIF